MSSQIFFHCPHCEQTEKLTLEEFHQIGAPLCPIHQTTMISKQGNSEVTQAVGEILSGVTRLAAVALKTTTSRGVPWLKKTADE